MPGKPGIKLPASLVQELGIPNETTTHRRKAGSNLVSHRKAARKAARIEKRKKPISSDRTVKRRIAHADTLAARHDKNSEAQKKPSAVPDEHPKRGKGTDVATPFRKLQASSKIADVDSTDSKAKLPRKVREKLADDDAEIAALERRLGLKGGQKRLPKSFDEDGLGELLGDLDDPEDEHDGISHKKPRMSKEEEDWLRAKRLKAHGGDQSTITQIQDDMTDDSESGSFDDLEGSAVNSDISSIVEALEDSDMSVEDFDSSSDSDDSQNFQGFQDDKSPSKKIRQRENPYIAPQTSDTTKYIPPSLRKARIEDTEGHERLRKQIQGTLNRLSEAKLLAITSDMEEIYRQNPRQHVSTILLDTLFALICDPSPLQDTFMILHGGFVAALYKTIGTEFGAQVIQRFIEEYDSVSRPEASGVGKRLSNMVTFLAELYNFQVIGSPMIYDMIRNLTVDLNEENAELLLRIARNSGTQLRQDDPASLKDIVTLLHAAIEKKGAENLSIRTKFMIETIENLKNNKVKTGLLASNIRMEHSKAMKKILGSMNKASIRGREPLRIGLSDIRNADKRGKWWLIGASFTNDNKSKTMTQDIIKMDSKSISTESPDVDLNELAREQGMNTEIRRVIFLSLVSAYDHKDACVRLNKLGMKSKQRYEIPRIVVHCVGAEKKYYNRFYTKIARKLCAERDLRKSFQFTLWDIFNRLEEGEENDEDRLQGELDTIAVVFIAKMYGELVADGLQNILLLKHIDLAHPNPKLKTFAQVFLVTIFQQLAKSKDVSNKIKKLFAVVEQEPGMLISLQLFLKKFVRSTKLVQDETEKDLVRRCCRTAETVLLGFTSKVTGLASSQD